ncbi:MAG: CHAT domain-containing protein, partial [candidate division KSB1 bacterium]|nr:CHAT domain-containing protein [candidate division KSB1 bacterium]
EAVRICDLRRALLDCEPQIVHFSGHGQADGNVLEDETGKAIVVEPEALAGLFELFSKQVECVLLNACYSETQAAAINRHIKYVVGMVKEISDRAAIEFAVGKK